MRMEQAHYIRINGTDKTLRNNSKNKYNLM